MCPRINKTKEKSKSKISKWNQLLFQCLILFGNISYYANRKIAEMNEEQIYELFLKIDNLTNQTNLTI